MISSYTIFFYAGGSRLKIAGTTTTTNFNDVNNIYTEFKSFSNRCVLIFYKLLSFIRQSFIGKLFHKPKCKQCRPFNNKNEEKKYEYEYLIRKRLKSERERERETIM